MNQQKRQEKVFGPYDSFPIAHISCEGPRTLIRTFYKQSESEAKTEEPEEEKSWKKIILFNWLSYALVSEKKEHSEPWKLNVLEQEVLCNADGFEIHKREGKYYIHALNH